MSLGPHRTPDGRTPLQLAISGSLPTVVEALCRRGVDMSVLDAQGRCPLWAALEAEQENVASILVRYRNVLVKFALFINCIGLITLEGFLKTDFTNF